MSQAELQRLLEIVNGNWGIEAAILAIVTGALVLRNSRILRLSWRQWLFFLPPPLQLAIAVTAISIGVMITRITIWAWRVFYDAGDFTQLLLGLLLLGATVGSAGFLWAIIEIGVPIFGNAPWIITVVLMTIFTTISLLVR